MNAEIITIGDEILIGQIVDTNSAWMGQELSSIGISVKQITSVSDDASHILAALEEAENRVDIVLITGGLGPTKDDITKHTLCKYFHCGWRFDEEVLADVSRVFEKYGRKVTELNRLQAQVPELCTTLRNKLGTAPGMCFEKAGKIFISMPGVPFEMKGLMKDAVIPLLQNKFQLPFILHKTILTQGIGESMLAEKIESWENALPDNLKLAYLPSVGAVRLRLSSKGTDRNEQIRITDQKLEELKILIGEHIYGYENDTLEDCIGRLLLSKKQTLSTAESFTGGSIAALITSVPGCSEYFMGGMVCYSNSSKITHLKVAEENIKSFGAVSQIVAEQLALGAKEKFNTDFAIATTGIAGPSGGSIEKPVGTGWIAVAFPGGVSSKCFALGEHRAAIVQRASLTALNMLRKILIQQKL